MVFKNMCVLVLWTNVSLAFEGLSFEFKSLIFDENVCLFQALEKFCQEVNNLYTAPRLVEPVWLNMMSHTTYKQVLCQHFLKDFIMACEKYDNKNTNL